MAAGSPPRVVQALDDAYSRLQELMPVEFPAAQSGASKHDDTTSRGEADADALLGYIKGGRERRGPACARADPRSEARRDTGCIPLLGYWILDCWDTGYWGTGWGRAPRMRTGSGHRISKRVTAGWGRVP